MTYDFYRKIVEEQNRLKDLIGVELIDKSLFKMAMDAAVPIRQAEQLLHTASDVRNFQFEAFETHRRFIGSQKTLQSEIELARQLAGTSNLAEHLQIATSAYQFEHERVCAAAIGLKASQLPIYAEFDSIKKSIEEAMRLSDLLRPDHLIGMSAADLLSYTNPLCDHIEKLNKYAEVLYNIDSGDTQVEVSHEAIETYTKWVRAIKETLKCIFIAINIWMITVPQEALSESILELFYQVLTIVTESHNSISTSLDGLASSNQPSLFVTTTEVRLRAGPSTRTDELEVLDAEAAFRVTRYDGDWASGFATLSNGTVRPGWIHIDYLVQLPNLQ